MSETQAAVQSYKSESISRVNKWLRSKVLEQLALLKGGAIHLNDPFETLIFGDENSDISVNLSVSNIDFYRQVALQGSIGAAESYMADEWQVDDLTKLIRLFVINRDLLDDMESGTARVKNGLLKVWHFFNKNNHSGSRKNIAAHYDLGNEFFKLFLDKHLMYSSGIYTEEANNLEAASDLKLKTICEKLDLSREDSLIEIGTGWGGFAIYAAKHYGCHVTTTTISEQQFNYAEKRIKEENLQDKITLLKKDYRELEGCFDKLVSIEMIEAVGHHYLDTYFEKCSALLKPDGLALIQAITIEDHRYSQALKSVDFIKRYIFPGSFIPCVSAMTNSASKSTNLRLINLEDFGESYALTLRDWRLKFDQNLEQVKTQGFSDAFIKMWEFYLCYCEGGFIEKAISDVHLLFAKPKNDRAQWLNIKR